MPQMLDKVLVVDIEATCWEGATPKNQKSEVIEFGLTVLNIATGEIESTEGILVRPSTSSISAFCTSLTSITPEMIAREGIDFRAACQLLKDKYQSKSRLWASFGAYDYQQILRQCQDEGVDFPLSPQHLNVKALFSLKYRLKHPIGMAGALAQLGLPLEGTHHRGADDSRNIAKILQAVLW